VERRAIAKVLSDAHGKYRVHLQPAGGEAIVVSRDRGAAFRQWLGG
jgi:hypothetical protein